MLVQSKQADLDYSHANFLLSIILLIHHLVPNFLFCQTDRKSNNDLKTEKSRKSSRYKSWKQKMNISH